MIRVAVSDKPSQTVTLAVLKVEMDHIFAKIAEIKDILKDSVRPTDFAILREKVIQNEEQINRLKTLQVYIAAIAAVVSPILLIILSSVIKGLFGS